MPHLGRWLNRDPLQEQGGINLYGYVHGDPLGYVDPDGRYAIWVARGVAAAVGAGSDYLIQAGFYYAAHGSWIPWDCVDGYSMLESAGLGALGVGKSGKVTKGVKALPAPRQIDAKWSVNKYRHGGEMSAIEHINYRHAYTSGFSNVSKFGKGTSVKDIRSYVDSALRYGKVSQNGKNGYTVEYNLGRTIGTNSSGGAASNIRVHVRDGNIQTASPF